MEWNRQFLEKIGDYGRQFLWFYTFFYGFCGVESAKINRNCGLESAISIVKYINMWILRGYSFLMVLSSWSPRPMV